MLNYVVDRSVVVKRIAIATCCASLDELLRHLLRQWKFAIHPAAAADVLLLAEEGCAEPRAGQKVLWLAPAPGRNENALSFPLCIETLWKQLELFFHQPPRRHLRLDTEIAALISVDGENVAAEISSISDMGARFIYHRELVRDQRAFVTLTIGGVSLRIDSRIIYAIPRSATAENEVQIGVLFAGIEADQRQVLQSFLLLHFLRKVREEMVAEPFEKALGFLELPEAVRTKLRA